MLVRMCNEEAWGSFTTIDLYVNDWRSERPKERMTRPIKRCGGTVTMIENRNTPHAPTRTSP
jgi:hypothetical protein